MPTRLEPLAGIRERTRQRTARTSRGAKRYKARKNNRMMATWPFYLLSTFIASNAERFGMRVEQVDPADTSQTCPACFARTKAHDRRCICGACGWTGHTHRRGGRNH
jgi:putative transposase